MNVLIVESKRHLAELWRRALERLGAHVDIASSQDQAADMAADSWSTIGVSKNIIEASRQALSDSFNYRLAKLSKWSIKNKKTLQLS